MRTAIIIPARLSAQRLPRKPLAQIGNLPLVVLVARQASKCRFVDSVAIATPDVEIAEAVEAHGYKAILTRDDHESGTDRVAEAAKDLQADLIINVQGDEPFIDSRDLDNVAVELRDSKADIVTLKAPIARMSEFLDPNVVKVVTRDDNSALYFSRAPIPYDREQTQNLAKVFKHIGVYGYKRAALERMTASQAHPLELRERLEQLRAMAIGMSIVVLESQNSDPGRGIDTEEDLAWARTRVKALGEAAFP